MIRLVRIRQILAVCILTILAVSFVSGNETSAHAAFDRSDPPPNAILPDSPETVQVWFTEPLEFDYSTLTLYDERGAPVPGASSEPGDDDYSLRILLSEPLDRGTYSVVWDNLSAADGHTAGGYIAFTVGTAADVTTVVAPVDSNDDDPPI